MELDFSSLLQSFMTAKPNTLEEITVSDYVMTHILEPMLYGVFPKFSELDFDAFDEHDLDQLQSLVTDRAHQTCRHIAINRKFCETDPVSTMQRSFC